MVNIWFISDTHFSHANTLVFKQLDGVTPMRSFSSVEEMDETMVERWNAVVKPSDHVYHLGDVAMARPALQIVKRLNGHKRLLFGNHDIYDYKSYTEVGFKKLMSYRVLDNILFSHIPVHADSMGRFKGNVHGHVHTNGGPPPPFLNISVEVINYTPISFEEIQERLR